MKNKLLLSTLVIASTINLSKVSASQTVIDYPIDVVGGATLNLASNENGYMVTEPVSIYSSNETVSTPVTYNAPFSAEGSATLSFADVRFNDALTLTPASNSTPTMTVSGNMKIAGTGTINTGDTIISFSGDNSELDISDAFEVTFDKLNLSGKDSTHKLMINYGDAETVRTDYDKYRNNLRGVLTNMQFSNAEIQDIWVTGGNKSIDEGYILEHHAVDDKFFIGVRYIYDDHEGGIEGTKFIGSDENLSAMLASRGAEVIAPGENDMDNDTGTKYELDFGRDINRSIPSDGVDMLYNSAGNVFDDWEDITYDLDSSAESTNTGFTFDMDIRPGTTKTLHLKSTNPNLTTLIFNGEQNEKLTIALKSAGIREVAFSPVKASYAKIDTSETFDATKDSDNLNIRILDTSEPKDFFIYSVPTVGNRYKMSDETVVTPTYSLTVGKNVNAVLTSCTFNFNGITVDTDSDSASRITVIGPNTTLNL